MDELLIEVGADNVLVTAFNRTFIGYLLSVQGIEDKVTGLGWAFDELGTMSELNCFVHQTGPVTPSKRSLLSLFVVWKDVPAQPSFLWQGPSTFTSPSGSHTNSRSFNLKEEET